MQKTATSEPLIQIHPSVMSSVQNHLAFAFKPGMGFLFWLALIPLLTLTCSGSSDPEGLLTFKFDTSASDWDNGVYMGVVRKLVDSVVFKDGKSILECVPSLKSLPMLI